MSETGRGSIISTSIIIRTKNEEKWLGTVLQKLVEQTCKDFEVIIVDSGSHDRTLDIAKKFLSTIDIKIIRIKAEEFNYPFACNYGAQKSQGKFLVYLSGHSLPIDNNWLESGIKDFSDEEVAGVFGACRALPDASFWERVWYGWGGNFKAKRREIKKLRMGILGNTNAMIRKNLWQKYNFNLEFASGGEDGDWARHFFEKGYKVIFEPGFSVYHSHSLGFVAMLKQIFHWYKVYKKFKKQN